MGIVSWYLAIILGFALAGQTSPSTDEKSGAAPAASAAKSDEAAAKTEKSTDRDSKGAPKKAAPAKKGAKPAKKGAPAARPTAARVVAGPRVLSKSEMRKARSPFLDGPGSEGVVVDRYAGADPIDWRDVPAWRQGSFFGIRAAGRFFVYVIDCSESMIEEDRFARATMEVRRSVLALQAPQQFEVIFYNEGAIPMPGGPQPRPADSQNKDQLVSWLRIIDPDGGTDPLSAMRQALGLRPEAVFLLSDGEFPPGTAEMVSRLNVHRIPIHCVDMSGGEGGDHLRRIARESGGKYAIRMGNLQGKK